MKQISLTNTVADCDQHAIPNQEEKAETCDCFLNLFTPSKQNIRPAVSNQVSQLISQEIQENPVQDKKLNIGQNRSKFTYNESSKIGFCPNYSDIHQAPQKVGFYTLKKNYHFSRFCVHFHDFR